VQVQAQALVRGRDGSCSEDTCCAALVRGRDGGEVAIVVVMLQGRTPVALPQLGGRSEKEAWMARYDKVYMARSVQA